jgi:hypothetical protein
MAVPSSANATFWRSFRFLSRQETQVNGARSRRLSRSPVVALHERVRPPTGLWQRAPPCAAVPHIIVCGEGPVCGGDDIQPRR